MILNEDKYCKENKWVCYHEYHWKKGEALWKDFFEPRFEGLP